MGKHFFLDTSLIFRLSKKKKRAGKQVGKQIMGYQEGIEERIQKIDVRIKEKSILCLTDK